VQATGAVSEGARLVDSNDREITLYVDTCFVMWRRRCQVGTGTELSIPWSNVTSAQASFAPPRAGGIALLVASGVLAVVAGVLISPVFQGVGSVPRAIISVPLFLGAGLTFGLGVWNLTMPVRTLAIGPPLK
jgi:hypothetical protein